MATFLQHASESTILDRASAGKRLSASEILSLYEMPADEVIAAAHAARSLQTDPEVGTYSIGGNIDYTNVCVVACKFCAFYRARHQDGAFTLSIDQILGQMAEIVGFGGADVLIQGGVNPDLPFSWYIDLIRTLKHTYPQVHIDAFSPEEILGFEKLTGMHALEILGRFKDAGMDGMPGAAAEILVDEVRRRTSPTRIMTGDWFRISDAALRLHLHNPWVSMVYGFGETKADRVAHLLALRAQQDRALEAYGFGFAAFKAWPARIEYTRCDGDESTMSPQQIAAQYVQEVAICRLALNNVRNHRAVWRTMGFGVAAQAMRAGANDLCGTGSINAINATMTAAGKCLPDLNRDLLDNVKGCIAGAGFTPALRDPYYRVIAKN